MNGTKFSQKRYLSFCVAKANPLNNDWTLLWKYNIQSAIKWRVLLKTRTFGVFT